MKRFLCLLLFIFSCMAVSAQSGVSAITGTVLEEDSGQSVIQAAVQLLSAKDSSMIVGTISDVDGNFRIKSDEGNFILKVSSLGFTTQYRNIYKTASREDFHIGKILLPPDVQSLKAATVAAKVEPLKIIADTVVYNPAAFRVSEDAMLEDLLAKIPGLEVSHSGSVTLHGKAVREILVNGKRFFGGDVKTGLKNLSADMIENIKAYERESDFTRLTGVDDGEEVPVLDLTIKKNMLGGWKGRIQAGGGPADDIPLRYNSRLNANKITNKDQTSVLASARNVSGKAGINTTSRSQLGYGSTGLQDFRELGISLLRKPGKAEISGNVHYGGFGRSLDTRNQSESASTTSSTYSNSNSYQNDGNNNMKAEATIEYRASQNRTLYIRPVLRMEWVSRYTNPFSSSFSKDPLTLVANPNDWLDYDFRSSKALENDPLKAIRTNSSSNRNSTYSDRFTGSIATYYTIRSEKNRARNITFRLDLNGYNFNQDNYIDYFVFYPKKKPGANTDTRKHYVPLYENQFKYQPQVSVNLPLTKNLYFQGMIMYGNEIKTSDRSYYSLKVLSPGWTVIDTQDRQLAKKTLPDNFEQGLDPVLSSYGSYRYQYIRGSVNLRYSKRKLFILAGAILMPQWGAVSYHTDEQPNGLDKTFSFNVAPNITLKYNRVKTKQISLTYRSWSTSPTLYNLLPCKSGTNPLSIHIGNSSLKPSFTHRLNFSYNYSNLIKQTSFVTNIQGTLIQNAQSNSSEYIEDTGGRINTAKNIDGNWNAQLNYVFNKTFKDNHFSMSNHGAAEYQHNVSYLYNSSKAVRADEINTMPRLMVKEALDFSYRNDILELIANAGGEYTNETSLLRPEMTQQPFGIKGGLTATFTFPWKMRFSADFNTLIQRGYLFDVLNRNFYYLNIDLTQTVLKGKGTLKLDAYDLLNQAVNMTRSFSASSRSINTYNGVGRYITLSFIYRFSIRETKKK